MGHASADHGAEGRVIEPSFGIIRSVVGDVGCVMRADVRTVVGRGDVDETGGVVGGSVSCYGCCRWMCHHHCWGGRWVEGVLPLHGVLANMEGAPNHQDGLGVELTGVEGVRQVDTSMFCSMLRESSFGESRIGQL